MSKTLKRQILIGITLGVFVTIFLNLFAFFHAKSFTHFVNPETKAETLNENSSVNQKLNSILFGVTIPKPQNEKIDLDFVEIDTIIGDVNLEIWRLDMEPSKEVVVLFHGYKSTKSQLWKEAQSFYRMGYSVVLVDFRASGNSDGFISTIGYFEAIDVANTFEWCKTQFPNQRIYLYGVSMGAAAIVRAVGELKIQPNAIMVQSSFATMQSATKKRFKLLGLPSWPMANLLTFWGGSINGFDAFEFNPIDYASSIETPTLVIHGALDNRVSLEESQGIYNKIKGKKEFGFFGNSGHESILNNEEANWNYLVTSFLESTKK